LRKWATEAAGTARKPPSQNDGSRFRTPAPDLRWRDQTVKSILVDLPLDRHHISLLTSARKWAKFIAMKCASMTLDEFVAAVTAPHVTHIEFDSPRDKEMFDRWMKRLAAFQKYHYATEDARQHLPDD
jgi:hypothetical protein